MGLQVDLKSLNIIPRVLVNKENTSFFFCDYYHRIEFYIDFNKYLEVVWH